MIDNSSGGKQIIWSINCKLRYMDTRVTYSYVAIIFVEIFI